VEEVTRDSGGQMRMRWTGHVACRGRKETRARFWWGNLREKERLKDQRIDGRIILKLILIKSDGMAWTVLVRVRIAASGGPL
jgi:hypothetical protein